jgi:hypothetical protein
MKPATILDLNRTLSEHVGPCLERYHIAPISIKFRQPVGSSAEAVTGAMDAAGITGPQPVPDGTLEVELTPRDWARLFLPVQRDARHEHAIRVDVSDPDGASYPMLEEPGAWVTCSEVTMPAQGLWPARTHFLAVASPRHWVLWRCESTEHHTYEELHDTYPLFGLPNQPGAWVRS